MVKNIQLLIVCLVFLPLSVFAYSSPGKPTGYVNDFAKIISASDIQTINGELSALKSSTQIEVAVVTISTFGNDETIETYANKLFQEWGIGVKGKDNGLLILVALNDRQARIEVGYGLEGTITDLQAGNIVNKVMIPALKNGDYSGAIKGAVAAVLSIISNPANAALYSEPNKSNNSSGSKVSFEFIVFILFIVGSVLTRLLSKTKSWWLGGVLGAGIGVIVGLIWGFFFYGIGAIILFSVLGLIFDYFVSKHPPKFRRFRRYLPHIFRWSLDWLGARRLRWRIWRLRWRHVGRRRGEREVVIGSWLLVYG